MKRLIFGCFLMLSGVIGGSAWLLADKYSGYPGLFFFNAQWLFYILAVVGAVVAVMALKEENKKDEENK